MAQTANMTESMSTGVVLFDRTPTDPTSVAITHDGASLSWEQLEHAARRFAQSLAGLGLRPGDAFGLLGRNSIGYAVAILGNAIAGTLYVPMNWHLNAEELGYLLSDSGAKLILVDPGEHELGQAAATAAGLDRVYTLEADGSIEGAAVDGSGSGAFDPSRAVGMPLLYTGGTTGRSKGVVRSDFATTQVGDWPATSRRWAGFVRMPNDGTCLITTPIYHAFGYATLTAALATGNRVVLHDRFDPIDTLKTVERDRVTALPLVPTQIVRLLKLDDDARVIDLSSLQWILHTAAPCPAWAKRELIQWVGPIVVELYGSSEGGGPIVCTSEEWLDRPGTVGRPAAVVEAFIVDDDGNDVPNGDMGTLYFRRRDGAPTYHGDEEKTAAGRLADGRFTVGDIGWMDDDGYLYLADRRVDLILRGGVNVYPREIEEVLVEHPAVTDAAVFGLPDDDMGQQVKAVVTLRSGQTDASIEAELIGWCRVRLAAFKCPTSIDVTGDLPREASGKLKKRLVRERYLASDTQREG